MHSLRSYTPAELLVFGGICCFAGFLFLYNSMMNTPVVSGADEVAYSAFQRAQYYFNADNDPSGPYDLALARKYYQEAIAENPAGNILQWYQLGRIDFLEGRFGAALYHFKQQQKYFGNQLPAVHYMLGLTYGYRARQTGNQEDWQQAEAAFEAFLEIKPESPWARTDLAWVFFMQGKYEEMKPLVETGLRTEPTNPWLHNMYGLALLNTGNQKTAVEHFALAAAHAAELTSEDWGSAYPGNDPATWEQGLAAFQRVIAENSALAQASTQNREEQ